MSTLDLDAIIWRASSFTSGQGNCVEVTHHRADVPVRDTKDRSGGALSVPANAWTSFLRSVRSPA
jgi:hypothetical protein